MAARVGAFGMAFVVAVLYALAGAAAADNPACAIATHSERIGNGTVVYNEAGAGPTLLLVHGLFADKEQWTGMACQLVGAGYRIVAPDLPGYGKSTGFGLGDYRLERQVALLRILTTRLRVDRLDIAGNSMGGTIASLYARRYPAQVRSLACMGSPLGIIGWNAGVRDAIYGGINPFVPINDAQLDVELGLLFVTPPALPPAAREAILTPYTQRNRHYVQVWNIVSLYNDTLSRSPPARVPTLIVWGDDDHIFDVAGAERLHRRIPGSEVQRLPHAGHLLHLESVAAAAPLYQRFLQDVDSVSRR
jgi:pimeloyl-ACP methyl ester carboxylesterase